MSSVPLCLVFHLHSLMMWSIQHTRGKMVLYAPAGTDSVFSSFIWIKTQQCILPKGQKCKMCFLLCFLLCIRNACPLVKNGSPEPSEIEYDVIWCHMHTPCSCWWEKLGLLFFKVESRGESEFPSDKFFIAEELCENVCRKFSNCSCSISHSSVHLNVQYVSYKTYHHIDTLLPHCVAWTVSLHS